MNLVLALGAGQDSATVATRRDPPDVEPDTTPQYVTVERKTVDAVLVSPSLASEGE